MHAVELAMTSMLPLNIVFVMLMHMKPYTPNTYIQSILPIFSWKVPVGDRKRRKEKTNIAATPQTGMLRSV